MKLYVYASTTALEAMARGEEPSQWALDICHYEQKDKVALIEGLEIPMLPRTIAAELALKALNAEAAVTAAAYKARIAKLLAIEYTPPSEARDDA